DERCAWCARLHLHVIAGVERDLTGVAEISLQNALPLQVIVRIVFNRLELLNRLSRLRHDLFVLRQLRLSPYARVVGIFRIGRRARRRDCTIPRVPARGVWTSRLDDEFCWRRAWRRKDASGEFGILIVANLLRPDR